MRAERRRLEQLLLLVQLSARASDAAGARVEDGRAEHERRDEALQAARDAQALHARAHDERLRPGAPLDPLQWHLGLAQSQTLLQRTRDAGAELAVAQGLLAEAQAQWRRERLRHERLAEEARARARRWQRRLEQDRERSLEDRPLPDTEACR